MIKYILHAAGAQTVNKHIMQMERHIYDKDIIGNVQKNILIWAKEGYCQIFWSEDDIERIREQGKKLLIPKIQMKTLQEEKKAVKLYWKSSNDLLVCIKNKLSQEKLAKLYDAYSYALRRVYAHFITSTGHTTLAVETQLREILESKFGNEADHHYQTLTNPIDEDILFRELTDWVTILENPTDEKILKHTKKYSILFANVFSEQEALNLMKNRILAKSIGVIKNEIKEGELRRERGQKKLKEILRKLKSKKAQGFAKLLRQLGLLRLEFKSCWNGESYHLLPFYEKVAELAQCSVKDIYLFYSWKEISDLLHNNASMSKDELERRKKYWLMQFSGGEIVLFSSEEALKAKEKLLNPSIPSKDTKSFTGTVASKGIVAGQALIVRADNPTELAEIAKTVKPNTILVTGMTNPTMMVLISKVKGIITDEGGAACHAAIIAREFNLPCIVGCHVATLILDDGDYILLDANKGTVKKISENEFHEFNKNSNNPGVQ